MPPCIHEQRFSMLLPCVVAFTTRPPSFADPERCLIRCSPHMYVLYPSFLPSSMISVLFMFPPQSFCCRHTEDRRVYRSNPGAYLCHSEEDEGVCVGLIALSPPTYLTRMRSDTDNSLCTVLNGCVTERLTRCKFDTAIYSCLCLLDIFPGRIFGSHFHRFHGLQSQSREAESHSGGHYKWQQEPVQNMHQTQFRTTLTTY